MGTLHVCLKFHLSLEFQLKSIEISAIITIFTRYSYFSLAEYGVYLALALLMEFILLKLSSVFYG